MSDLADVAERPVPANSLPIGFGPQVDQILPAVAELQAGFYSPYRNKHVQFMNKKTNRVIDFRFTTYSALNDLLREPMRAAGLIFMHFPHMLPKGNVQLVTRLIHYPSGQYCYCTQPLVFDGSMQEYGSARTYACRYGQLSLLNICGDEDDDANIADRQTIIASNEAEDDKRTRRTRYEELVHVANTCRAVDDAELAAKMLRRWNHDREEYLMLPRTEGRKHQWPVLIRSITSALERVHGPVIAQAWRRAIEASSQAEFDEMRRLWETEWRPHVERMRSESKRGYEELGVHMKAMGVWLLELLERGLEPGLPRIDQAPPMRAIASDQGPTPDAPTEAKPTDSATVREESPTASTEPAPDHAAGADREATPAAQAVSAEPQSHLLRDDTGDVVDEPFTDPVLFVDAYLLGLRLVDDPAAMARHNRAALAWASEHTQALSRLAPRRKPDPAEEAQSVASQPEPEAAPAATPEPAGESAPASADTIRALKDAIPGVRFAPVVVPTKARGTPDLVGYIRVLKGALAEQNRTTIKSFYECQRPVFESLGDGIRMQALTVCENRIKQLEAAS